MPVLLLWLNCNSEISFSVPAKGIGSISGCCLFLWRELKEASAPGHRVCSSFSPQLLCGKAKNQLGGAQLQLPGWHSCLDVFICWFLFILVLVYSPLDLHQRYHLAWVFGTLSGQPTESVKGDSPCGRKKAGLCLVTRLLLSITQLCSLGRHWRFSNFRIFF